MHWIDRRHQPHAQPATLYVLIAAAAAMGLTAWVVLAADASCRARSLVAGVCILSVLLQLVWDQRLAGMLIQVVLVIGLLMYRRFHGSGQ